MASLAITVLYGLALTADISRHHWADALDSSRDAVPAVVGWGALVIVLFTGGTAAAERMLSVDNYAISEKAKRVARDQDSVRSAELRVRQLTGKLDLLTAARDHATPAAGAMPNREAAESHPEVAAPNPEASELDREVAETTARLEQAKQWLTGARAALAASRMQVAEAAEKLANDFPEPAKRPDPGARKPA